MTDAVNTDWGRSKLGELFDKWPKSPAGEPVGPAFLAHCTGIDMDDTLLINMLDAFGIPAMRRFPNDGQFGMLILGMSGSGVDIYVPETLLEDAQAILDGEASDELPE